MKTIEENLEILNKIKLICDENDIEEDDMEIYEEALYEIAIIGNLNIIENLCEILDEKINVLLPLMDDIIENIFYISKNNNNLAFFLKKDEINVTNLGKKYKVTLRILQMEGSFAPIYDSGCCLAREKSEEAINQMLNDSVMLDSFINRGKSEIRWDNDGRKLNHFDLVRKVREENKETVDNIINKVISLYSEDKIKNIVVNIDKALPDELYIEYGLSKNRKMLICKLIDERIKRLKDILI